MTLLRFTRGDSEVYINPKAVVAVGSNVKGTGGVWVLTTCGSGESETDLIVVDGPLLEVVSKLRRGGE